MEKTVDTPAGKRLREEAYSFSNPFLKYPKDLVHLYVLEIVFRGLKLDQPGSRHNFNLWLPPNVVVPMYVKVKGKETVKLPHRSREAYRLEIVPDMTVFLGSIVGKLITAVLPRWKVWFDVHGTHPIVKYDGPLGKVNVFGVPDEIYELIKVSPEPDPK